MIDFGYATILLLILLIYLYLKITKMARAGSPFFKIGYCLYTKTRIGYLYYRRELSKAREKFNGAPHSIVEPTEYDGLKIIPIPMSLDNYAYMIKEEASGTVVLIDPSDADAVQAVLDAHKCRPTAILTTHKHWDHSGGNKYFRQHYPSACIYGCIIDEVPDTTNSVTDGEDLIIGQGHMTFKVYYTPGHTVGHVVYCLIGNHYDAPDSLFSGDALFLGGCGRMFEGNAATMLRSLDRIAGLNEDTLLWPGHEYAKDNLEFALSIEPDNEEVKAKLEWVKNQRSKRFATCPSVIGEERSYNPFLRTDKDSLLNQVGMTSEFEADPEGTRPKVLFELRTRKDKFKYKL
ncbi:probable hydrolase PNKD [Lineus longissimus]|uniref:probable hydrolase PNKD n=1 Tax=Lineus longissimus TaxID=88925 RepID=UPI002B4C39B6